MGADRIDSSNFTGAVEYLLQVVEDSVEHQRANAMLGSCFLALERPDLAENFLYTAVRVSNYTDEAAVSNLVQSLRLRGALDLATDVLQKSLSKQESVSTGILEFAMGEVLSSRQEYSEAADWFLASALRQPEQEEAWLHASTLHFPPTRQNYSAAETVLTQALALLPSSADLSFHMGGVYLCLSPPRPSYCHVYLCVCVLL